MHLKAIPLGSVAITRCIKNSEYRARDCLHLEIIPWGKCEKGFYEKRGKSHAFMCVSTSSWVFGTCPIGNVVFLDQAGNESRFYDPV